MTVQTSERVRFRGEDRELLSTPLCDYLRQKGLSKLFDDWTSTDLWRGYEGTWEVDDGRLYLSHLHGYLKDGTIASMRSVFPECGGRVFASWYSGTLRIPDGRLLCPAVGGFEHIYERDILLTVQNGLIVDEELRENSFVEPVIDHSKTAWEDCDPFPED